jgi:hypothetical protein
VISKDISLYLDIQDMDASPGYGSIPFSTILIRDCFDRDRRNRKVNCIIMGIIAGIKLESASKRLVSSFKYQW